MAALVRQWRAQLVGIAAVGLVIRLVYVLAFKADAPLVGDGVYYHRSALLLPGRGFIQPDIFMITFGKDVRPAADHPPGYTVALGAWAWFGLNSPLANRIWSALLGTMTVVVVGFAGRRIAGPRVGLFAAGLAAVYPNLWINDALVMSETLTILAAAVVVWTAYWFWQCPAPLPAGVVGLAVAALVFSRAEALFLPLILLVPLCLTLPSLDWRRRLRLLVIAEVVVVACLTPWVAFNLSRFKKPVIITTGLGYAMNVASCDPTFEGPLIGYWLIPCGGSNANSDASENDAIERKHAFRYIGDHVGQLPKVGIARLGRTWGFFRPAQQLRLDRLESGRDLPAAWAGLVMYWVMVPASVVGAVVLRRRGLPLLPMLSMVIMVSVAVLITFGQTRYRAAAEASLVLLTAVASDAAWSQWRGAADASRALARPRP